MLYTTQKSHGVYKVLNKSILTHYKKNFKTSNNNSHYLEKKISIKFLFFFIYQSFKFLIFFNREKFLLLRYCNCYIGRHVTSLVYRDVSSHKSALKLIYNYIKYFFIAGLNIESANYYVKNAKAIYIDHPGYLNGVYFTIFAEHKKVVYTHCYPRGLFCIDFSKINNFAKRDLEKCLKIDRQNKNLKKKSVKNYLKRVVVKPEKIPHLRKQKWGKANIELKKIDYVIYTHSFVDGLMWWGIDGFINLRDWTEFTIDKLIKKKANVLVKVHPNFFQKDVKADFLELDKKIFKDLMKKYSIFKNVSFIDYPVKNIDILKNLRKDAVIISHHGTALLEGISYNYKCISSRATLWNCKNFKVSNVWQDKETYSKVLKKNWKQLSYAKSKDFKDLENQIFGNDFNIYGNKYWQQNLSKILQIHLHTFIKDPHKIVKKLNKKKFVKAFNKLSKCIETVNL